MASSRPVSLNLDAIRALLGCLLVLLQARTSAQFQYQDWGHLKDDWALQTAIVLHLGWLLSATMFGLPVQMFCCASRVIPKLSLLSRLFAIGVVPATAAWFSDACWQRQRWYWRAMAEVFVYNCGEFSAFMVMPAAVLDIACTVAIWAGLYSFAGVRPATTGAAHVLLRSLLALGVHHFQRHTHFSCVRRFLAACWTRYGTRRQTIKVDASCNILLPNAPVYNSLICCNNPTLLSRIIAASPKDLEPVRVERLSTSRGSGEVVQPAREQQPQSLGGTEAYDLARRLVSSAGTNGSTATGSRYTSAAQKVRVSVKIPDRSPEDLSPGWDTGLQINGQRESALVLFTYMRRGCIQLVLDFFAHMPAGALPGGSSTPRRQWRGQQAATRVQGAPLATAEPGAGAAAAGGNAHLPAGGGQDGTVSSVEVLPQQQQQGLVNPLVATGPAPSGMGSHWLRAIGDSDLFAGRTVTVQVDANVSRVSGNAAAAGTTGRLPGLQQPQRQPSQHPWQEQQHAGNSEAWWPATPSDVRVQPQVVCTASSVWRTAYGGKGPRAGRHRHPQHVLVNCSWGPEGGCKLASTAPEPGMDATQGPGLQLTARQQGQFLPVAQAAAGRGPASRAAAATLRADLARRDVFVAVLSENGRNSNRGGLASTSGSDGKERGADAGIMHGAGRGSAAQGCRLAFLPARGDGLVQVELSRGGVHSASAASVLLVSSAAVAGELAQLQALAAGDLDASGPSCAMVQDVLRDYGVFLDLVPAIEAAAAVAVAPEGSGPAPGGDVQPPDLPLFEWVLPPRGSPDCAPSPRSVYFTAPRHQSDSGHEHRQRHVLALAAVSSRVGFNLLRFFLSYGLASCAIRVLDVLHGQLGLPAALVAGYVCPEGLALLHHSARSRTFASMAAVAGWLEARGVAPAWGAPNTAGLTPLHLLAVVPGGDALGAMVRVRWRAARPLWRHSETWPGGCGASPEEFVRLAAGAADGAGTGGAEEGVSSSWQRAADVTARLGFGAVWERGAGLSRRVVPEAWVRAGVDAVAPGLSFVHPGLEASYASWLARRTLVMDHLFHVLYTFYCVSQICKHGWMWFQANSPGLILLLLRLVLLAVSSPVWAYFWGGLQQRLCVWRRRVTGRQGASGRSGSSDASGAAARGWVAVPGTREGTAVLLEALRAVVMLSMVAGVLPIPVTWRLLVQLRLDWVFNVALRPTSSQMRVLPSIIASALAIIGEAAVTTVVLRDPGCRTPVWVDGVLAVARGVTAHGLGLGLTVWMQSWSRGRFLELVRERRHGTAAARGAGKRVDFAE